jgi:hypothetical protein
MQQCCSNSDRQHGSVQWTTNPCAWDRHETPPPPMCVCVYVCMHAWMYVYVCVCMYIYTGCPERNVKNFGSVFLVLKYTDITQNTYIQSWTVTEIMAREKCGHLWGRRTVAASWQSRRARPSVWYHITSRALSLSNLHTFRLIRQYNSQISCTVSGWRQRWAGMRNV